MVIGQIASTTNDGENLGANPLEALENRARLSRGSTAFPKGGDIPESTLIPDFCKGQAAAFAKVAAKESQADVRSPFWPPL